MNAGSKNNGKVIFYKFWEKKNSIYI
jgi:hypothetical protein